MAEEWALRRAAARCRCSISPQVSRSLVSDLVPNANTIEKEM